MHSPSFRLELPHRNLRNLLLTELSLAQGEEDDQLTLRLARENLQYLQTIQELRCLILREGASMENMLGVLRRNNLLIGAYQGMWYQMECRQDVTRLCILEGDKLASFHSTEAPTVTTHNRNSQAQSHKYQPELLLNLFLAIKPKFCELE